MDHMDYKYLVATIYQNIDSLPWGTSYRIDVGIVQIVQHVEARHNHMVDFVKLVCASECLHLPLLSSERTEAFSVPV